MNDSVRALPVAVLLALATSAAAQGDVERVSVATSGAQSDALLQSAAAVSDDGRYVAFSSTATTLVPGVVSGRLHVYLRDRVAGTTELLTQHLGVEGDGDSDAPAMSADGRWIAFHSAATNLGPLDVNGYQDVYLLDRQTGAFTLVTNGAAGGGGASGGSCCPDVSADGRWVAFYSGAPDMVLNDLAPFADAFVFDRLNATTPVQIVSVGPGGIPADFHSGSAPPGPTNGQIAVASNPNGTDCRVAFQSLASNLVPGANTGFYTIYMRDTQLATTSLVSATSTGAPAYGMSLGVSMSDDARYVAFTSNAIGVVPGDTSYGDTYVRDVVAGTTTKVSRSSQQVAASGGPFEAPFPNHPSISADGRFVAFETHANNLVANDTNGFNSVFVRDLVQERTWRVDTAWTGAQANGHCVAPRISGDGGTVVFVSASTNLVAGDTNARVDVYAESFRATTFGFCYGDGTGTACPCGNSGRPEKGCENSRATGGALLLGIGTTSASNDTLLLAASTLPPNTSVLFLQGTAPIASAFGDGLRCAGGAVVRLGRRTADASGACAFGAGIPGDPSVSSAGSVPAGGGTRTYQAWYRNPAGFCTSATFNLSNGLSVAWAP